MITFDTEGFKSLNCYLRVGEVTSVDVKKVQVRVTFDDENSLTSNWLQVLQKNTLKNKDYVLPDIGEDVVCLFMSEGFETGFVIGSFYADEIAPPDSDADIRSIKFSDDSHIRYNRKTHTLSVGIGSTKIVANQESVSVETSTTVSVKGGTKVSIEGGQQVLVNAGTSIDLTSPTLNLTMNGTKMTLNGSSASIESSQLTFEGPVTFTSDVSFSGNVQIAGDLNVGGNVHAANI